MIDNIIINFNYDSAEIEIIKRCLHTLYSTAEGSCPLDRGFGLNLSFLDQPQNIANNMLALEVIEKTEKYESRVKVLEATFKNDLHGSLTLSVLLGKGEENE